MRMLLSQMLVRWRVMYRQLCIDTGGSLPVLNAVNDYPV